MEEMGELRFSSFDGGGPAFRVAEAPAFVAYSFRQRYEKAEHDCLCGAGYEVIFHFTGLSPGRGTLRVEERSPIAENLDHFYAVTVDEARRISLTHLSTRAV